MSPALDERLFAEVGFPRVSGDEPQPGRNRISQLVVFPA